MVWHAGHVFLSHVCVRQPTAKPGVHGDGSPKKRVTCQPHGAAWWTGASLANASAQPVQRVIRQVQQHWAEVGATDAEERVLALGWGFAVQRFDARVGGLQALLVPHHAGGFFMVVDPDPTPAQASAGFTSGEVIRWRTAHEYAHTFFYTATPVPSRSGQATLAEERFCDEFARQVTGLQCWSVDPSRPRVYSGTSSQHVA